MTVTHLSTIEADVRKIIASCELVPGQEPFFMRPTFISNVAQYVQRKEHEASMRSLPRQ